MDKSTMLSYGVPEVGKSGFQATLASATGKEPSASGADERGASSDDPLGDFIAFDNAAPSLLRPAAADAHGEQEQQQEEQQAERQQMPSAWCDSRRYSGSLPLLVLHEELLDFWQAFQPTGDEEGKRRDLVRRVEEVVQSLWPSCSVHAFGSYQTGLYLPESDIDLTCLDTGIRSGGKQRTSALQQLGRALRRAPWPLVNLEVVATAKVPIVKFIDGETGIAVDICVEERSGFGSSQLARKAMDSFPAYKVLVVFLKRLLNTRGLHDTFTGGVGSYLLQLMVIASLQHPPDERTCPAGLRGNLGSQLLHFLELYGVRLNYEKTTIVVREGGRFVSKRSRRFLRPEQPGLLSIESPIDVDVDVGAKAYNIASVRRVFQHSYFTLLSAISEHGLAHRNGQQHDAGGGGKVEGGAGRGVAPSLYLLDELMEGLAAEMGDRFAAHEESPRAPAPAGKRTARPLHNMDGRTNGKRKRAAEEDDSEEEEGSDDDGVDDDAYYVDDSDDRADGEDGASEEYDDEDDDDDDGEEEEDELFNLRSAKKAMPTGGRRHTLESILEVEGGRSEQPRPKGASFAGDIAVNLRAGARGSGDVSGPHPREMNRKDRRQAKRDAKYERRMALIGGSQNAMPSKKQRKQLLRQERQQMGAGGPAAHGKDFANRRQMQMQKPRKQNKEPMMSGKEMKRTRRKQRRLATMKAAIKAMEDQQRG